MYFTYLAFHTESLRCGLELCFDRSLFPFLTTQDYFEKLTVYEMPRVDANFSPYFSVKEIQIFDVEFSQFQGTGMTLKCTENTSTSFMQIIHSLDKSMYCKTSRLFYALLCFAVPPLLLGLKLLNHRAKNAHHNKFCLLWLFSPLLLS